MREGGRGARGGIAEICLYQTIHKIQHRHLEQIYAVPLLLHDTAMHMAI